MNLLDLIPFGKENKVTTKHLMRTTGKSMRTIRQEIKPLKKCCGVCTTKSDGGGYWRSDCNDDKKHTASTLETEAFDMLRTAREIRGQIDEVAGQEELELEVANGQSK